MALPVDERAYTLMTCVRPWSDEVGHDRECRPPTAGTPHGRFEAAGGGPQDLGPRGHSLTLPSDAVTRAAHAWAFGSITEKEENFLWLKWDIGFSESYAYESSRNSFTCTNNSPEGGCRWRRRQLVYADGRGRVLGS